MATKRLYRSKHGEIFGVCKGIAQWRDLPEGYVRLAAIIITVCTAFVPCVVIYSILGFLLPVNPYEDEEDPRNSKHTYYYNPQPDDFVDSSKASADAADANERYERRKKENEWDSRFNSGK